MRRSTQLVCLGLIGLASSGAFAQGASDQFGIDDQTLSQLQTFFGSNTSNFVTLGQQSTVTDALTIDTFRELIGVPQQNTQLADGDVLEAGCRVGFCDDRGAVIVGSNGQVRAAAILTTTQHAEPNKQQSLVASQSGATADATKTHNVRDFHKRVLVIFTRGTPASDDQKEALIAWSKDFASKQARPVASQHAGSSQSVVVIQKVMRS